MKAFSFFLILLVCIHFQEAAAFTTQKREPSRVAFQTSSRNSKEDSAAAAPGPAPAATTRGAGSSSNTAAFAFAPAQQVQRYAEYYAGEELDDELVIGYGTALVSCILSVALGFGLGYGT